MLLVLMLFNGVICLWLQPTVSTSVFLFYVKYIKYHRVVKAHSNTGYAFSLDMLPCSLFQICCRLRFNVNVVDADVLLLMLRFCWCRCKRWWY